MSSLAFKHKPFKIKIIIVNSKMNVIFLLKNQKKR